MPRPHPRREECLDMRAGGAMHRDIADALGMSIGTVSTIIYRARQDGDPRGALLADRVRAEISGRNATGPHVKSPQREAP